MAKSTNKNVGYEYFNKRPLPKDVNRLWESLWVKFPIKSYNAWGSIDLIKENLRSTWSYSDEHFKRYWADQLVREMGFMLWNSVYNEEKSKVSEKAADKAVQEFENKFR